ncbi:MAG: class I SAM-dependent methyltransferase [Candidatus Woesearchaeota archaeon]
MLVEMTAPNVHAKSISLLEGLHGNLLDLGCGAGALCERIASTYPHKFQITGADFIKKNFKAKTKFIATDLNRSPLPFKNKSFDVIMLVEVIEHVRSPAQLLDEIHRILKKGGRLIISTPNVENWQSRIHFALQTRFFSFLESDMAYNNKSPGMGHLNPLFDFQLNALTHKKFVVENRAYNRIRIPIVRWKIPTMLRILGEVKIIRLKKI